MRSSKLSELKAQFLLQRRGHQSNLGLMDALSQREKSVGLLSLHSRRSTKCMLFRIFGNPTDHSISRWDSASSMYKVVSSVSAPELDELDENVFVARRRVGEHERKILWDRR